MKILINAGCEVGGGVQVCDSLVRELHSFPQHEFLVCASPQVRHSLGDEWRGGSNVRIMERPLRKRLDKLFCRGASAMDRIVAENGVDAVFTVFGPSYWRPAVPHLCGFAKPQYIYPESPFFKLIPWSSRLKLRLKKSLQLYEFRKFADVLVTENADVSARLGVLLPGIPVETVSNTCHQVFNGKPSGKPRLPSFDGVTLLTVSAYYPHKNVGVLLETARVLRRNYPDFRFRFVISHKAKHYADQSWASSDSFVFLDGVSINDCPSLYEQADFMILPTLLECFSASYPEAMKMERPILTSDLPFARQLCGEAASYFDPLSPEDIAAKIVELASDAARRRKLVEAGREQLRQFLSPRERAGEYLRIMEGMVNRQGAREV